LVTNALTFSLLTSVVDEDGDSELTDPFCAVGISVELCVDVTTAGAQAQSNTKKRINNLNRLFKPLLTRINYTILKTERK